MDKSDENPKRPAEDELDIKGMSPDIDVQPPVHDADGKELDQTFAEVNNFPEVPPDMVTAEAVANEMIPPEASVAENIELMAEVSP
ncbi:hypothetical protein HDE_04823 [Halotydeus destructor]|nr:hypothetical protein HDE_04823 [Halotydeus destructor]